MGLFNRHKHSEPAPDCVADRDVAFQQAENCIRIIQESSGILQNTDNPDTFFSRLSIFEEQIQSLKRLSGIVPMTVSPDDLFAALQKDKQEIIYNLIIRAFNTAFDKAQMMKTTKGKNNQYQKFYDSFQPYLQQMNEENIRYIDHKYRSHMVTL